MRDTSAIDSLFDALSRYTRIKDRAATSSNLRTPDGAMEIAAFKCLFHLEPAPLRSRELAETLSADPSTISRHVAQLVERGYVRREADPNDGRATLLVITDEGRETTRAIRERRRAALDAALGDWTDEDMSTLITLLNRFLDAAETVMAPNCTRGQKKS